MAMQACLSLLQCFFPHLQALAAPAHDPANNEIQESEKGCRNRRALVCFCRETRSRAYPYPEDAACNNTDHKVASYYQQQQISSKACSSPLLALRFHAVYQHCLAETARETKPTASAHTPCIYVPVCCIGMSCSHVAIPLEHWSWHAACLTQALCCLT